MFGRSKDYWRFFQINVWSLKDVPLDIEARINYVLNKGSIDKNDLRAIFREEADEFLEFLKKKPLLSREDYVLKYFFTQHNKKRCPVKVGQIVGFRASISKGDKKMKANVKIDGTVKKDLDVEADVGLGDYVLVHNRKICYKLSEKELAQILSWVNP